MISRAVQIFSRGLSKKHVKLMTLNSHLTIPDTNNHLKREVLFRSKTKDRRDVIYELAVPEDTENVAKFMKTFFFKNEPLNATIKLDDTDANNLWQFYSPFISFTIMAKVDGNIVGATSYILEKHKHQKPKPIWPADFGKLNDAGPTKNRKVNIIMNFLNECDKIICHALPAPSYLAHAAILTVHPAFLRQGIGFILDIGGYKVAHRRGVDYIVNTNTSVATNNMVMDLPGQKFLQKFNYTDYVDYGNKPFKKSIDDFSYIGIYTVDLKKYWPSYEKLLNKAINKYK